MHLLTQYMDILPDAVRQTQRLSRSTSMPGWSFRITCICFNVAVFAHFENEMDNIILLVVCLPACAMLRYFRLVPDSSHVGLNAFIINVSLPALTLNLVHQIHPEPRLAVAVLMP